MNAARRYPTIEDYLRAPDHPLRQAGGRRSARRSLEPDLPLVSVLTIVRNRKDTLPGAIRSVLSQTYPNIEYIVIDGASTDGSLEVIKQFDDKIDLWISEPDRGTADAINKAISVARGDYVACVWSDDWIEADFIEIAVSALLSSGAAFVFGDLKVYESDALVRQVSGDKNYANAKESLAGLYYQTMVIRKKSFQEVGLFDLDYKICVDFEWALRLHLHGGRGFYENRLIGNFRLGGISGSTSDFTQIFEKLMILRQHGLLTARAAAPHVYRLMRYSAGYIARLLLPDSIHRGLKRIMRRSESVPLERNMHGR